MSSTAKMKEASEVLPRPHRDYMVRRFGEAIQEDIPFLRGDWFIG